MIEKAIVARKRERERKRLDDEEKTKGDIVGCVEKEGKKGVGEGGREARVQEPGNSNSSVDDKRCGRERARLGDG